MAIWLEVSLDGREAVMVKNLSGLVGCLAVLLVPVGAVCFAILRVSRSERAGREERGERRLFDKGIDKFGTVQYL